MPKLSELTPSEEKKKLKLSDVQAATQPKPKGKTLPGFDPNKPVAENMKSVFNKNYAGYDSFGHRLLDLPIATGQLVANTAALLPIDALKENAKTYNDYVRQREEAYQKRNPDNLATNTGAVLGITTPFATAKGVQVLDAVASAGKVVPRGAGALRTPANVVRVGVGSGAQGAVASALTPETSGDFWEGKVDQMKYGAATGFVTPVALMGAAKTADSVADAIRYAKNPDRVASERLAEWYGKDPETIAKLRNAPQYFEGEQVTAAQALQTPRALAVEKALGNNAEFKIMSEEIKNANNAGRVAVVEGIAKTPEAKNAAIAARKEATEPFYKEFVNPVSPFTRYNTASSVLDAAKGKRMSAEDFDVIDKAGKIVRSVRDGRRTEEEAAQLLSGLTAKSATAQKALEQATASVNKNMIDASRIEKQLQSLTLNQNGTVRSFAVEQLRLLDDLKAKYGGKIPLANLQGIQQSLADEFNTTAASRNFDKKGQYVLGKLNAKFNTALDRAAPGYRDNSRKYAELSQPINDMEAGQAILKRGEGRTLNTAGEAPLSLADLNRAIGDDGKARYGMSDSSLAQIMGLRDSMTREGMNIKSPGSDTAYNLNADGWLARAIYGNGNGGSGAATVSLPIIGGYVGDALGGGYGLAMGSGAGSVAAMALNSKVSAINSRIASEAAKGVYNSRVAADMIEQVLQENPKQAQALLIRFPGWRKLINQP